MKALVVIALLIVAACSSPTGNKPAPAGSTVSASSPAASAVAPAPTPTPALNGSYAVLVKDFLTDGGANYTVSIVAADGRLAASATARKRTTPNVQIGNLSTSATTVYYLDGDSNVRFLRPDRSTGLATHILLGSKQAAAFSVSPDDLRIAVSVLDYTRYPVSTRLYVENLNGGGNHIDLFSASNVMEWPVGWHAGQLVIALGLNVPPQNLWEGFQPARGYHVADANSGKRLQSLCTGEFSVGIESRAGAVCENYPTASVASWDGSTRTLPKAARPNSTFGDCPLDGPISTSGVVATTTVSVAQGGCTGGPTIFLVTALGKVDPRTVARNVQPIGWTDANHLVVDAALYTKSPTPALSIVTVSTGASARIATPGFFAAQLPGGL
jgi:hypothetical protein